MSLSTYHARLEACSALRMNTAHANSDLAASVEGVGCVPQPDRSSDDVCSTNMVGRSLSAAVASGIFWSWRWS